MSLVWEGSVYFNKYPLLEHNLFYDLYGVLLSEINMVSHVFSSIYLISSSLLLNV